MLITVGSESFPCLACYLHLGFNKEGARIHFSVSYLIFGNALIFHQVIAQQYHPDFGIYFGLHRLSSLETRGLLFQPERAAFHRRVNQQPLAEPAGDSGCGS